MEHNIIEELSQLISSLSEKNFKKLLKNYAKQYYKTNEVNITDGPYDGGIDLIIYKNGSELKKNIQITVNKSNYKSKIIEDISKAANNVKKFGYQSKLDFYISHNISKSTKNELIRMAELDYRIDLKIIDAFKLAEDSEEFSSIKTTVYEIFKLHKETSLKIDKQTKLLFDVLAIGSDASTLKKRFITSFILSYLFENPNSTVDEITSGLKSKLSDQFDKKYCSDRLNDLKGKGVIITPEVKNKFVLSDKVEAQMTDILQIAESQEGALVDGINQFLSRNGLGDLSDELLSLLHRIYKEHYEIDLNEINSTNNSFGKSLRKCYDNILSFFTTHGIDDPNRRISLTKELLNICGNNEYLSKISVSIMFTSLFKSDGLDAYLRYSSQKIVMDTQVLLRYFCVKLKESEYDDVAYKSVKKLLEILQKYGQNFKLMTTSDYIEEVAAHIWEAAKLQRFLGMDYVKKLGPSKNVFYRFFSYLKSNNINAFSTFSDFMHDLIGIELPQVDDPKFMSVVAKRLNALIEMLRIDVVSHPFYDDFHSYLKEYEIVLAYQRKDRTYVARQNDLRTVLYLSSKENHIDDETGIRFDPFFVTWDSAFYDFRKTILEKFSGKLEYWYLYSPLKLAERLSVMNFRVEPQCISYNIIALAETDFEYSSRTVSFFDLFSSLFHRSDISELDLAKKLADLQDQLQGEEQQDIFEDAPEKRTPLTDVLLEIRDYYVRPLSTYTLDDLVLTFETSKLSDNIIEILLSGIDIFKKSRSLEKEYFQEFDILISKAKFQNEQIKLS